MEDVLSARDTVHGSWTVWHRSPLDNSTASEFSLAASAADFPKLSKTAFPKGEKHGNAENKCSAECTRKSSSS